MTGTTALELDGTTPVPAGTLGLASGAALYVGSLIGPGVLFVPSLAAQTAGPASVVSWGLLLLISAPLAFLFAALGMRLPLTGGVSEYVRAAFGRRAGLLCGGWFLTAVLIGAPCVAMIGGSYVAALTGSGNATAAAVAGGTFAVVLCANAFGLRISARLQLIVASVLVLIIGLAVGTALPSARATNWTPFAPHGWLAVGSACSVLVWLFVGWESVAQLVSEFREPERQLPKAMTLAYVVIAVLYSGLAVATVAVGRAAHSRVPLADLMGAGLGQAGRQTTALLAVALTMATMNVYIASASRLASSLALANGLPRWLGRDGHLTVPRRPLLVLGCTGASLLTALALGVSSPLVLARGTSACFVAVYAAATAAAARILSGAARLAAVPTAALVACIAAFSGWYLSVPLLSGACFLAIQRRSFPSLAEAGPSPAGQEARR